MVPLAGRLLARLDIRAKLDEALQERGNLILPVRLTQCQNQMIDSLLVIRVKSQCCAALLDRLIHLSVFQIHRTEKIAR